MPAGIGYDSDAALAAIDQMLAGGGASAAPPMGATPTARSEGVGSDVVAGLVAENVQLRALLGLGPNDPIPAQPGMGGAPVAGGGAPAAAGGAGFPPV